MSLIDDVRTSLRVTTTLTDDEVQTYIDFALFDMENKGVKPEFLSREEYGESVYPAIVRTAVIAYCKASYGYDNSEAGRFLRVYNSIVASLLNGCQNINVQDTPLADADIQRIPPQPYTGSAVEPEVVVRYYGRRLEEGTDYTVAYEDNVDVGTATARVDAVIGSGNAGSASTRFEIVG